MMYELLDVCLGLLNLCLGLTLLVLAGVIPSGSLMWFFLHRSPFV